MKKFLLLVVAVCSVAFGAEDDMQIEAVRAFQAGDYPKAKTLFETLAAQNPRNTSAQAYLRMIAARSKGPGLEAVLRGIMIPNVDLQDVSAREAVSFVTKQVRDISQGKHSLNVVWMVPENAEKRVSLTLQNVPASEVLRYIAEASNLTLNFDSFAMKVSPTVRPTADQ